MKWDKLGMVWSAKSHLSWGGMGTLTPTPILVGFGIIRVFCGIRDDRGVARIGYFDVMEQNPTHVVGHANLPVLDVGSPGAFDDNGLLLGDFLKVDDQLRMYYVGFQRAVKAKFLAYGGLAISKDHGKTFSRFSAAPIIDRDDSGLYIRAIHCIRRLKSGRYRAWYSEGASWEMIDGMPYPNYNVAFIDSDDGLQFPANKGTRIQLERSGEYRLGRSRVFSLNERFHIMTFTYGTVKGAYQSGYAVSEDLLTWERRDDFGLEPGRHAFDSRHLAYPALIKTTDGSVYCFYNGNDMGAGGIGVARLLSIN